MTIIDCIDLISHLTNLIQIIRVSIIINQNHSLFQIVK